MVRYVYQERKRGRYPYLVTRVKAMKSVLLTKNDYEKVVKMDVYTLIKFLEDKGLAYNVDTYLENMGESHASVVENIINSHLETVFSKVLSMAYGDAKKIIFAYLVRFDIENIKTILRGKLVGEDVETIKRMCVCGGVLSRDDIEELYKVEDVLEIFKRARIFKIDDALLKGVDAYIKEGRLDLIENVMDRKYYTFLKKISDMLDTKHKILIKFAKTRADIVNLRILYRLKRDGFGKEEVMKYLLDYGYKLTSKDREYLASAENLAELHARVKNTFYGKLVEDLNIEETLFGLEQRLEQYYLSFARTMLHTDPLSINPIIAFLIMKEVEAKNLKFIVRAKEYGFSDDFINDNIVVVV